MPTDDDTTSPGPTLTADEVAALRDEVGEVQSVLTMIKDAVVVASAALARIRTVLDGLNDDRRDEQARRATDAALLALARKITHGGF